jgi:hygromycin-B 7''-O-kinase
MPALEAYIEEVGELLDHPFKPVLLHADLTDDHFFVQEREGRWQLTGLIDFGDAMVGDPLYEFAAPAMFLSQRRPEVQRAMLRGYGLRDTPGTADRIRAWTILHRFGLVENGVRFGPEPAPATFDALLRSLWSA